jgi:sugar phosphate isomerase/epimerase
VIPESEGAATLKRCFEAAGLTIVVHHPLRVGGRTIHLDGFDPARKVGFEYVTSEAGDRAELTADVVAELEAHMRVGDYYLLLVDEREVDSVEALERAAAHFLRVALARRGAGS